LLAGVNSVRKLLSWSCVLMDFPRCAGVLRNTAGTTGD
jgi:hypothetical protein